MIAVYTPAIDSDVVVAEIEQRGGLAVHLARPVDHGVHDRLHLVLQGDAFVERDVEVGRLGRVGGTREREREREM